ncbi:MAG: hypothetical protein LBH28_08830 [Oscillospiraceae bacterium]|nr:hypothetical protein [Oscillospiraceae bacterium]
MLDTLFEKHTYSFTACQVSVGRIGQLFACRELWTFCPKIGAGATPLPTYFLVSCALCPQPVEIEMAGASAIEAPAMLSTLTTRNAALMIRRR